jgi:hypothetical protein
MPIENLQPQTRNDRIRQLIGNWLFIQDKAGKLTVEEIDRLATWIDNRLPEAGE